MGAGPRHSRTHRLSQQFRPLTAHARPSAASASSTPRHARGSGPDGDRRRARRRNAEDTSKPTNDAEAVKGSSDESISRARQRRGSKSSNIRTTRRPRLERIAALAASSQAATVLRSAAARRRAGARKFEPQPALHSQRSSLTAPTAPCFRVAGMHPAARRTAARRGSTACARAVYLGPARDPRRAQAERRGFQRRAQDPPGCRLMSSRRVISSRSRRLGSIGGRRRCHPRRRRRLSGSPYGAPGSRAPAPEMLRILVAERRAIY